MNSDSIIVYRSIAEQRQDEAMHASLLESLQPFILFIFIVCFIVCFSDD